MTGRGRPRKERSPDTKCAKCKTKPQEMKQAALTKCGRKDSPEDRQNGTTKEQKQKEPKKKKSTEKEPAVQGTRQEKTTKHCPEENKKQQRRPADNTQAPIQGVEPKTCAGGAKAKEQSAAKITGTLPEKPKDATKAKTYVVKTKSEEKSPEEKPKVKLEKPEDTRKDPKTAIAKPRGARAKSPVEFAEEAKNDVKIPKRNACNGQVKFAVAPKEPHLEPPNDIVKAKRCADKVKPPGKPADEAALDKLLRNTLEKLKIKMKEKSDASELVNTITKTIITHLKQNTTCFKEVGDPIRTGSYYEFLKISNPDEFDVMLPMPVNRVEIKPFGDNGAFYSVALKREQNPLKVFQQNNVLSASAMLKEFRDEVKKSVKTCTEWEVTKKKPGCPAVTLTTKIPSFTISLDIVLCIVVKSSWPSFTTDGLKIENWLGTKQRRDYRREPYYLVPKYEGKGDVEINGVLAKDCWRVSFSHIEKAILKNHGSDKTCCERGGICCCRKDCLKLMKHLLSQLKENYPSFNKFCSYHVKTTLLHACCSRTKDTDWTASNLSHCFKLLLMDFVHHLERGELSNFFIPTQNLLSVPGPAKCMKLACRIREECDEGFPIFK